MSARARAGWLTPVLAAALIAVSTSAALAQVIQRADVTPRTVRMNTLLGPTGLITVPTAYVAPNDQAQWGMTVAEDFTSVSGTYGLADYLEVGAAWLDADAADSELIVHAKLNVVPANLGWFQLGLGVVDPFDALDDTYYIVASSDLLNPPREVQDDSIALRVHLGYGNGYFGENPIGGGELFLTPQFSVVGEYNGDSTNWAARYSHSDQRFRLQLGILDSDFFVGSTYAIDF